MDRAELDWDEARALGIPEIDAEHKRLYAVYNAIRASLADGSYRVDPQAIADRMLSLENALGK